jgi:hypothetical protein
MMGDFDWPSSSRRLGCDGDATWFNCGWEHEPLTTASDPLQPFAEHRTSRVQSYRKQVAARAILRLTLTADEHKCH